MGKSNAEQASHILTLLGSASRPLVLCSASSAALLTLYSVLSQQIDFVIRANNKCL